MTKERSLGGDKSAADRVIAIIPARGGSERVANKNLLPLAGYPLVVHSILHARQAQSVGIVYVSSDDDDILRLAEAHNAEPVRRPSSIATAQATSESALLHVLDDRRARGLDDPELVVFLQCTSPVRRSDDIDRAVATLREEGADSLFSACDNNRLIWARRDDDLVSINYDFRSRQREQDMAVQYRENGSIYVFKPEILRKFNNRLGGRKSVYLMDYWSSFQVDTPEHVELLQWIMQRREFRPAAAWPKKVGLVVFDFDGVMTDNTVEVDDEGHESVRCLRADGLGLDRLRRSRLPAIVLSTETNAVVQRRCEKLRLSCHHGLDDKAAYLKRYLEENKIDPTSVVYLGNDVNDLGCLQLVGCPVVVADAHPKAKEAAAITLDAAGGHGAVRELCDRLLDHLEATGPA